jgi:hypothetical protein
LATPRSRTPAVTEVKELKKKISSIERAPGAQDLRAGGRGGTLAGLDVNVRVSRARTAVATGRRPAVVARLALVSRQPDAEGIGH